MPRPANGTIAVVPPVQPSRCQRVRTFLQYARLGAFNAIVGFFLFKRHQTLFLCSSDPHEAVRRGLSLRTWDFLFYTSFGIVVTDSVKVAGVLAVFSFLIVPMVCATLLGHHGRRRLLWAWGIGFAVCLAGSVLSYLKDLPMGASIVCLFGLVVAVISFSARLRRVSPEDM